MNHVKRINWIKYFFNNCKFKPGRLGNDVLIDRNKEVSGGHQLGAGN